MKIHSDEDAVAFLARIIDGIVRDRRGTRVRASPGPHDSIYLDMIVPDEQRGIIIGRGGRMFDALCHILRAYSAACDRRYSPRIVDHFISPTENRIDETESQSIRTEHPTR